MNISVQKVTGSDSKSANNGQNKSMFGDTATRKRKKLLHREPQVEIKTNALVNA